MSFFRSDRRKARKSHTCAICKSKIEKGNYYYDEAGADPDIWRWKLCQVCREIVTKYIKKFGDDEIYEWEVIQGCIDYELIFPVYDENKVLKGINIPIKQNNIFVEVDKNGKFNHANFDELARNPTYKCKNCKRLIHKYITDWCDDCQKDICQYCSCTVEKKGEPFRVYCVVCYGVNFKE